MEIVVGSVGDAQWADLMFAWRVCKHVSSNAIVLAKDGQTIGVGAGQMSRIDSVRIAIEKAQELGHDPAGSVLGERRVLPVPGRPAARARRRRHGDHPAGRLEARRRDGRGGHGGGRGDGADARTPLPALALRAYRQRVRKYFLHGYVQPLSRRDNRRRE